MLDLLAINFLIYRFIVNQNSISFTLYLMSGLQTLEFLEISNFLVFWK